MLASQRTQTRVSPTPAALRRVLVKKSAAGVRTVAVPREFVTLLVEHIETYVKDTDGDALLFTTPYKRPIRRGGFQKLTGWKQRVEKAGHKGLHFHDLRHTGNMLAAASGATTKDLMARMGHQSMAAALIYQHASREADRRISDHIGEAMRISLRMTPGTAGHATVRGAVPQSRSSDDA